MYDIVPLDEPEPVQVEEKKMTHAEYYKEKLSELKEVNEATEEPCCASTTRRKAKLVFKKIR